MTLFNFQDIEIHHKDHDAEISFQEPDHKMHEAIIIANFLYSPVLQSPVLQSPNLQSPNG